MTDFYLCCSGLKACALCNPNDEAEMLGSGPRYLPGDKPGTVLDQI